jgi:ubiquinone biosynthesis protein UbiJ
MINVLMIGAMLVGFFQIRHLEFMSDLKFKTDTTMTVTAFGMFAYAIFTTIAGVLNDNDVYEPGELVVTNGLIELLEVF